MMRDTVLAKAVIGQDTLLRKIGLVLTGSLLIALAAQVSVPFFPVPMTLSTLAVLIVGLTAGFVYGYVGMAWLAGLAVEKGLARGVVSTAICGIVVSALLYVPGLAWPAAVMGKTVPELWAYWMAPFLIGDAVKAVIAAMVVYGGWKALEARRG